MAEAAAWCANPWREIGTAKTNHQSGDLFRASLVVRSTWRFMRPFLHLPLPRLVGESRAGLFIVLGQQRPSVDLGGRDHAKGHWGNRQ